MKTKASIWLGFLQAFIGLGAFAGGFALVKDPTGSALEIPLDLLDESLFPDFLIPGIFLLIVNGLGSMIGAGLSFTRRRYAQETAIILGAILVAWIVIQVIIINSIHWLHVLYFILGLVELGIGLFIRQKPFNAARIFISLALVIFISCTTDKSIPFEVFTQFERFDQGSPLLSAPPPEWAAAAHAIVVGDTVHYFWSRRDQNNFWDLRHSYAPISNPALISHNPGNPILSPPPTGMDSKSIEYPCPFYNPLDKRYYMYYLVKENDPGKITPKQTGLLVSTGDFGVWERVVNEPVIYSEFEHEEIVAGHTAVTIVEDTIHIIYTALTSYQHNPTICHATAPLNDPKSVKKNPDNPIFKPSRDPDAWDSDGLLTPQVFEAGAYYYMLYAGLNGDGWDKGHCVSGLARIQK